MDAIKRNNVQVSGRGDDTLLLSHGFGTDQRAWRFVAPAFEDRHRVLRFDHVGLGGSDLAGYDEARHGSLEGYADDLLDVLDACGVETASCVAHSAGASIALLAAIRQPQRFRRLVLLGASPHFINEPPDYHGGFEAAEIEGLLDLMERDPVAWSQALAPLAMGADSPRAMVEDFGAGLLALNPLVGRRFARLVFFVDLRARLPEVRVPALVVQCRHDSIVPREVGLYLRRHLAGSRYRELDASGHCPHLSHPEATIAAIAEGLRDA